LHDVTAGRLREPHEGNFHQSPASHDALDFRGCEVPGSSRSSSDGNAGLVHIAAGFPLIRDLMPSRCCFPPVHSIAKLQCGSDTASTRWGSSSAEPNADWSSECHEREKSIHGD
jgi:hypothetical protein